jgi:hypothetical protein
MKYRLILPCALMAIVLFTVSPPAFSQAPPASGSSGFRVGLSLGYFSRAIELDEEVEDIVPKMKSLLASLVLQYEIRPGFLVAAHVGYSSSAFDGLTFRGLPYSIIFDSEAGGVSGLLAGAEVEMSVLERDAISIGILGQFFASLGLNKEWEIPGLAVEGSVKGKPIWMKASVGPVLALRSLEGFTPFIFPRIDYLWGNFELEQTVQDLTGNEKLDFKGKSRFGVGLGADFDLSASFRIRGEAGLYPRGGGTDFSFTVQTLLGF